MSSSSQTSRKLSPVRVMHDGIFDPNAKTFDMPKPTEDANAKAGRVSAFGHAVETAVQYAQDNIDFANNAKERLLNLVEQSDKLILETKKEQLSTALQNVYIQNGGNILKCEPEWKTVLEAAKKDEDFARLQNATSIENYANNVTNRYRITAIEEGIKKNNNDYAKLSVLQLKGLQNNLGIAYAWMADADDGIKKNGFLLYSEAVRDMNELLARTLPDGSPVFSDVDKLTCVQENQNILGTCYARVNYNRQPSLLDKLKFIESIENGTLSVDVKKFFAIPDEFIKDGTEAELGVFSFADMPFEKRDRLGKELRAKRKEEIKLTEKEAKTHLVQRVLSNEVPPTPSNFTYRQSVKDYYNGEFFNNMMATLNAENVPQKREKVLQMHRDFVGKLKFIPSEMLDFCFDAIVHPDPTRVVLGCDLADFLASEGGDVKIEDPQRLKDASPLLYGSRLLKNGTPPDVISELVRGVDRADENVKKQRIKKLHEDKEIKGKTTFESISKRLFGTNFWGTPSEPPPENIEVQSAMLRDYMEIVTGAYVKSGDLEVSQKIADSVVKQKWGTTEVNGSKELTAFPVESFWATNDFKKDSVIKAINGYVSGLFRRKYDFKKLPKYYVTFDETTVSEITNGQTPSYRLCLIDDYGILHDHINGNEERITLRNVLPKELRATHPLFDTERTLLGCRMFEAMAERSEYVKRIKTQKEEYKRLKEWEEFNKEHDERDAKIHEETEELRRKFEKKK
jgi:hypothetical protein